MDDSGIIVTLENKREDIIQEVVLPAAIMKDRDRLPIVVVWQGRTFIHKGGTAIKPSYLEVFGVVFPITYEESVAGLHGRTGEEIPHEAGK
jgi:hypothetical protein